MYSGERIGYMGPYEKEKNGVYNVTWYFTTSAKNNVYPHSIVDFDGRAEWTAPKH
jgi:hypothetical protein